MLEDARITAIQSWLENDLHRQISDFAPASCDASFRRYFRITDQHGTFIIMDAPPERENTDAFIKIAEIFRQSDINVPKILQKNLQQGFLLLEDFGEHCYLDSVNQENKNALYQAALDSLYQIQSIATEACHFPQYDRKLLRTELAIFEHWFLDKCLHLRLTKHTQTMLNQTWSVLIDSALQQPQVCVHRDYHSRNLMHVTNNTPGILDFQDAVIGPITYDLVSLLRDCYISWPNEQVEQWLLDYFQGLKQQNRIQCQPQQFKRWFDLMGLQRHLKAIGIFSRLKLRDAKPNYIQDIPRTLQYVYDVTQSYPELQAFNEFLNQHVKEAP